MRPVRRPAATPMIRLQRTPVPALASLPALATALRHRDHRQELPTPWATLVRYDPLVPMYRIPPGSPEAEAAAASQVLPVVADRLRRLTTAYAEWHEFDAPAFFDLSVAQTLRLVRIVERVTTVHVTFYADQLLPSFAAAVAYWQQEFRPAHWEGPRNGVDGRATRDAATAAHYAACMAEMASAWERAMTTVALARRLLRDEIGFWAANGAGEERNRYRDAWARAPGSLPLALPALDRIPTLTLTVDFPLPAARQPGRLRRLHRLQLRRRAGRLRARSA